MLLKIVEERTGKTSFKFNGMWIMLWWEALLVPVFYRVFLDRTELWSAEISWNKCTSASHLGMLWKGKGNTDPLFPYIHHFLACLACTHTQIMVFLHIPSPKSTSCSYLPSQLLIPYCLWYLFTFEITQFKIPLIPFKGWPLCVAFIPWKDTGNISINER